MVDKNGMRAGAGLSAVLLLVGFIPDWKFIVPVMAVVLGMGSIFGLRYSPLGATYRFAKKTFKLNIPLEAEEEPPPRFAQTLGLVFLGLGSLAFAFGWSSLGWGLALLVAALQGLLAGTGLCVGCEIYVYGQRFAAKGTA